MQSAMNKQLKILHGTGNRVIQNKRQFNEFLWLITKSGMRGDPHWTSYQKQCTPCDIHYNFIGKLESFNKDLHYIMTTVFHASEELKVRFHPFGTGHATNATLGEAIRHINYLTQDEKRTLYDHCYNDARLFGYSLEDILK